MKIISAKMFMLDIKILTVANKSEVTNVLGLNWETLSPCKQSWGSTKSGEIDVIRFHLEREKA